jgi:hypothetical protein
LELFGIRLATALWGAVVVFCLSFATFGFHDEIPRDGNSYFRTEELASPYNNSGTTFLMTNGWKPMSYVIPAFSPDNRFIHLGADMPIKPGTPFGRLARRYIDEAKGPIKMITNIPGEARVILAQFGLALTGQCSWSHTAFDVIYVCDLDRRPASDDPAAAQIRLNEEVNFALSANGWVFEQNGSCWSWNEDWGVWATPTV